MATKTGDCPNCHMINPYTATNCIDCGQRLPWADAIDAVTSQQQAQAAAQLAAVQRAADEQARKDAEEAAAKARATAHYSRHCRHCGAKMMATMATCPQCHKPQIGVIPEEENPDDEPSTFLNIAAFLVPLVGFFAWIFLAVGGNTPKKAGMVGRYTFFGFLLGCGVWFVVAFFVPSLNATSKMREPSLPVQNTVELPPASVQETTNSATTADKAADAEWERREAKRQKVKRLQDDLYNLRERRREAQYALRQRLRGDTPYRGDIDVYRRNLERIDEDIADKQAEIDDVQSEL